MLPGHAVLCRKAERPPGRAGRLHSRGDVLTADDALAKYGTGEMLVRYSNFGPLNEACKPYAGGFRPKQGGIIGR
jgi:hypothetical protein